MDSAERAKSVLRHYFNQVYKKAGLGWDSDGDVEIGDIVDHIVEAACEKMRREQEDDPVLAELRHMRGGGD